MKDLPHHIKKLNRRVVRSAQREEMEESLYDQTTSSPRKQTERQVKKQAKAKIRKERMERVPIHLTEEERNKKMTERVPVFDRINHAKPRVAKPTQKKTPRI